MSGSEPALPRQATTRGVLCAGGDANGPILVPLLGASSTPAAPEDMRVDATKSLAPSPPVTPRSSTGGGLGRIRHQHGALGALSLPLPTAPPESLECVSTPAARIAPSSMARVRPHAHESRRRRSVKGTVSVPAVSIVGDSSGVLIADSIVGTASITGNMSGATAVVDAIDISEAAAAPAVVLE